MALVVLSLQAALELVAEWVPEAKAVLDEVHGSLKAGMAAMTYLVVLSAADRAVIAPVVRRAGLVDTIPALWVGAGTLLARRVRGAVLGPLAEADEDDDLGLQGLIRRAEDLWGGLGPMALIVFPLLTLAAFGFAALILALVERRLGAPGDRTKVPCGHCGESIPASAPTCPTAIPPSRSPGASGCWDNPRAARRTSARCHIAWSP
jgi:hypothetical protein